MVGFPGNDQKREKKRNKTMTKVTTKYYVFRNKKR